MVSDAALRIRVHTALHADPAIDATAVSSSVQNSAVRLRGEVGSYAERLQAVERVAGIDGVATVHNDMTVHSDASEWIITGEQIATAIAEALVHVGPWSTRIRVSVDHHVVELEGKVRTAAERALIRHAVQSVAGVDFINNRITVEPRAFDGSDHAR